MLRINEERFLRNLEELAQIGRLSAVEGGGLDRRPFSAAARRARDYFCQEAVAASLETFTDGAANLSAKLPSQNDAAPTLLLGSHLDTVPNGGRYDGALGVVAALETLCVVKEADLSLPVHLEAISFTDEEGRFGGLFGSQGVVGGHNDATVAAFLTQAGQYPDDLAAMRAIVPGQLAPEAIAAAQRDPTTLAGFIELHIEQGPQLERANVPIGVVDAIFGRRSMRVLFHGRSDHAGTTPLHLRADALVAAAGFIAQAPQMAQAQFPNAVVTCGGVEVKPGVYNVVPNEAAVLVEFRAANSNTLAAMEQTLLRLAEEQTAVTNDLSFTVHPVEKDTPAAMDPAIQDAIRQAGQSMGYKTMPLSSGALHDAGALAAAVPTGMIFVPSINGRSHCPDEDTDPADLVAGANALLQTALLLAHKSRGLGGPSTTL
ncbi:MAG: Zn-dependent hydrolase [Chloroflexi bacterium]|nr:Zn-dependent hydrolase [Chloroflexota bacterium]